MEGCTTCRAIARVNFISWPKIVLTGVLQPELCHVSAPTSGTAEAVRGHFRHVASSRKMCCGGVVLVRGFVLGYWSKQSDVVLSSAEAELNGSAKGLSEVVGMYQLYHECSGPEANCRLLINAGACQGMLLRQGVGNQACRFILQLSRRSTNPHACRQRVRERNTCRQQKAEKHCHKCDMEHVC